MTARTYTAPEVAEMLGITIVTLYKTRRRRELIDKMPAPLSAVGAHKWERSGFDAWFTRYHPQRPPAPANDPLPSPVPASIEEHQTAFARAYGAA